MQSDKGEKNEARNFLRLNTKFLIQIRIREKNPFGESPAHRRDYTDFFKIFPLLSKGNHQQLGVFYQN
jgi:hypothetical protein